MLTLKKAEAIPLIRQAYDQKKLSAQNPPADKSDFGCYYRHPQTGAPCAVGVLIPDGHEVLSEQWNNEPVGDIPILDLDDGEWFGELQTLHDDWQEADRQGKPTGSYERAFIEHLGVEA